MHRGHRAVYWFALLIISVSLASCTPATPPAVEYPAPEGGQFVRNYPAPVDATIEPSVTNGAADADDQPIQVDQQVVTLARDLDLWTAPAGSERVVERPRLYQGSLLRIVELTPVAIRVRTDEGVTGWLSIDPSALSRDLAQQGERVRFALGQRVQVVWSNGLPLRDGPHSHAPKLREKVVAGTQAVVEELRGDWLRVTLDDGSRGWLRWYYDGTRYIDVLD